MISELISGFHINLGFDKFSCVIYDNEYKQVVLIDVSICCMSHHESCIIYSFYKNKPDTATTRAKTPGEVMHPSQLEEIGLISCEAIYSKSSGKF